MNSLSYLSVYFLEMFCDVYLPLLEVLDLSDNKLGNNGITELGSASDLKLLNQVKTLYLGHNQSHPASLGPTWLCSLGLTSLSLGELGQCPCCDPASRPTTL